MKRIIVFILALTQIHIFADPTTGYLLVNSVADGLARSFTTNFYSDTESYTEGGLTFTYPPGYWTYQKFLPSPTIPRITITVELNAAPSPTDTYSAVISSTSSASVTVFVYRISNGGTVTEASTGEVNVTIFAVDDLTGIL